MQLVQMVYGNVKELNFKEFPEWLGKNAIINTYKDDNLNDNFTLVGMLPSF